MSYYFAVIPNVRDKELYHFGIKGMKWGVRRFRNKDGSYTAAGKKRYRRKKDRVPSHEHLLKSRDPDEIYKYRKYYSDQELQGRLNRLNTEENVYRKTSTAKRKQTMRNVAKWGVRAAFTAGPAAYAAYKIYKNKDTTPYYKVGNDQYTWQQAMGKKAFEAGQSLWGKKKK